MIRPLTCICMLLAAGSGLYLYQTKHRAQLLDREIARTYKQIDTTRERIGALKSEWAVLTETERLAELATQHLALKTLDPKQFVAMADLGSRLPAPLPPGASMAPAEDAPAPLPAAAIPIAMAKPPAPPPQSAASTAPKPVANPPVQVASLAVPAVRPAPHPAAPAALAAPRPIAPAAASPTAAAPAPRFNAPVVNVSSSPIQAPLPGSIGESVARAARGLPPPAPAVISAAMSTVMANNAPAAAPSGSALGGVRGITLPAPVPFGAGQQTR